MNQFILKPNQVILKPNQVILKPSQVILKPSQVILKLSHVIFLKLSHNQIGMFQSRSKPRSVFSTTAIIQELCSLRQNNTKKDNNHRNNHKYCK